MRRPEQESARSVQFLLVLFGGGALTIKRRGAREAREAENSVGCGVVYIVIGALENVLDESG